MSKHKNTKHQIARQPSGIALVAEWPVHEVLLSKDWQQEMTLVTILIARRSLKSGRIGAASYLVDLSCLGVKQAQIVMCRDSTEYQRGIRAHIVTQRPMEQTDLNLAAKIISTGLDYAASLGFKPNAVFAQAEYLLAGADIDACPLSVRTGGPEGKPFFMQGPADDPRRVVQQLIRSVGAGNFHYYVEGTQAELGLSDEFVRAFPASEHP